MHKWFVILMSFFIALILMLLPMPEWAVWFRPAWVLLVLIYWTIMAPYRVNVGFAWLLGLIVDLLTGTLLGEHALAYTIVIYFVSKIYLRLRMSPLIQQGFSVFLFLLLYQFIIFCIQGFVGALPNSSLYWLSSLTSVVLWPWLFVFMRDLRRWFRIA